MQIHANKINKCRVALVKDFRPKTQEKDRKSMSIRRRPKLGTKLPWLQAASKNWRWKPFSITIDKLSYSWVDPKRHPTYHKRQRSTPPWLPCHKNTRRSSPWCCTCTTRPQASDKTSLPSKTKIIRIYTCGPESRSFFFQPTCKTALFGVVHCESIPNTVLVQ